MVGAAFPDVLRTRFPCVLILVYYRLWFPLYGICTSSRSILSLPFLTSLSLLSYLFFDYSSEMRTGLRTQMTNLFPCPKLDTATTRMEILASKTPQFSSRLLYSLPAELRSQIWHDLLEGLELKLALQNQKLTLRPPEKSGNLLSLLLACRQRYLPTSSPTFLYTEAFSPLILFFATNTTN